MRALLLIGLFFPFMLFSQGLKKVVVKNAFGVTIEKYTVLKTDNLTRQGKYNHYSQEGKLLVECSYKMGVKQGIAVFYSSSRNKIRAIGIYSENKRVGIWEFYLGGKLLHKYNYSMNEILVNSDESTIPDFKIMSPDSNKQYEGDTAPIFLGGYALINDLVTENLQLTYLERENKEDVKLYVTFMIDVEGEVNECKVQGLNTTNNLLVARQAELISTEWVAATRKGVNVPAKITIPIIIQI